MAPARANSEENRQLAERAINTMSLGKKNFLGTLTRGESCDSVSRLTGVDESTLKQYMIIKNQ